MFPILRFRGVALEGVRTVGVPLEGVCRVDGDRVKPLASVASCFCFRGVRGSCAVNALLK